MGKTWEHGVFTWENHMKILISLRNMQIVPPCWSMAYHGSSASIITLTSAPKSACRASSCAKKMKQQLSASQILQSSSGKLT